jgi:hypothetical protein
MNEKTEQPQEYLERCLTEHLQFMKQSAESYDAGFDAEAKRLAVSIRVLLHDTEQSHSLLSQLNKKDLKFYDTAFDYDPNNILTHSGLTAISAVSGQFRYIPLLDNLHQKTIPRVDFDSWWNKVVFVDNKRQQLSRKQIVLTAADQDGGAHVDPKIDEKYANLARNNSLAWESSNRQPMGGPERAAIRQIAHEVLKSLIPDYENKPYLIRGQSIFSGMTATIMDSPPVHKSLPKGVKIGRNDPCPCGSGKKYKRCCGH